MAKKKGGKYLGQFRGAGQFTSLTAYLDGDWEGCSVALNNLLKVPDYVREHLVDVANDIIVPAMDEVKNSGVASFYSNAPLTVKIKGEDKPWDSIKEHTTGTAYASLVDGGNSIRVGLGGENNTVIRNGKFVKVSDIISYVDKGTDDAPPRPLFQYTWDYCEEDVKRAVDSLFRNAKVLG